MRRVIRYTGLAVWLCFASVIINAQDVDDVSDVYVTTQDYANLRLGPGENWDILETLDFGLTLRASGRSDNGRWIQVIYDGQAEYPEASVDGVTYGWVAYWLLVWTGDIYDLPIDGVPTIRWARSTNTGIGARYYNFPTGIVYLQIENTIEANEDHWQTISQRWYDLESGFQTTCNDIPPLTVMPDDAFSTRNLSHESEFYPVLELLERLVKHMNYATTLFTEVCNRDRTQRIARVEDIRLAIESVDEANRQLNMVRFLLIPLEKQSRLLRH